MVLVEVYRIERRALRSRGGKLGEVFDLGLAVVGYAPRGPAEAIGFLTKWAITLSFDYLWELDRELRSWGRTLRELSREKLFLGTVPWNTHDGKCTEKYPCYWVFVDVGSPVRHVYFVGREAINGVGRVYVVRGWGVWDVERITVELEFFDSSVGFSRCWSEEKERLAEDGIIHTGAYCELGQRERRLVEKIVARAGGGRHR